jgi:imidazole glycerol-phosphate synthase subunit HisH
MRVTIFDYGAGNLHSLSKAIEGPGIRLAIETDPARSIDTDVLVLPGVGAFAVAALRIAPALETMRAAVLGGLPTLGICLGMQLLFDTSDEGPGAGLGVIRGRVERLTADRLPQIGWNTVDDAREPLLSRAGLASVYYANSFVCRPCDESVVTSWSTHEVDRFPATVRVAATVGVQFHPEKSSQPGALFIRAFLDEARR